MCWLKKKKEKSTKLVEYWSGDMKYTDNLKETGYFFFEVVDGERKGNLVHKDLIIKPKKD